MAFLLGSEKFSTGRCHCYYIIDNLLTILLVPWVICACLLLQKKLILKTHRDIMVIYDTYRYIRKYFMIDVLLQTVAAISV